MTAFRQHQSEHILAVGVEAARALPVLQSGEACAPEAPAAREWPGSNVTHGGLIAFTTSLYGIYAAFQMYGVCHGCCP